MNAAAKTPPKTSAKTASLSTTPEARLGRGLAALFGDQDAAYRPVAAAAATASAEKSSDKSLKLVPVAHLRPGKYQPRRAFDEIALQELADSIRVQGVLQPLLVRPLEAPNMFEIVAGERRWHAAQRAGVHEVPVVVRTLADKDALEIALIENIQRQDLNALEEAEGYERLMDEFGYTQDQLSKVIGKSRSHIANLLRLNVLPEGVKKMLSTGALTAGHARALVNAANPQELADHIVAKKLNVREIEQLLAAEHTVSGRKLVGRAVAKARAEKKDADLLALEKELSRHLGLSVHIAPRGEGGGALTINYRDLDQLDAILRRLRK